MNRHRAAARSTGDGNRCVPPSPEIRQVVRAGGSEPVRAALGGLYRPQRTRIRAGGTEPSVRVARVSLGAIRLDRARLRGVAEVTLSGSPVLWAGRVERGALAVSSAGRWSHYRPGDLFVASGPITAILEHTAVDLAVVDPTVLPGEFAGPPPASVPPHLTQLWWRTFCYAYDTATDVVSGPALTSSLEQLMAATTAALFRPGPQPADAGREPRPEAVRRALAFIDADPRADLTVSDIAAAAGTGKRALQIAFRTHLGTTPMGHLRQVRLRRAQAELSAADPSDGITVGEIAGRWGWSSPSRFAAAYRAAHGSRPSRELRTRPAGRDGIAVIDRLV